MNECFFLFHIILLVSFVLFSLKAGKESLITCFVLQVILANLFVTKQIFCFGLHITCTDVYTIGSLFTLNLLQEYFGKRYAIQAIWILSFLCFFFIVMSQMHLIYLPSSYDVMHPAFQAILSSTPKILFASLFVAILTQKLDVELFGYFKTKFSKKSLILRFGGTSLLTQLIDTLLFSFIALHGLVHNIGDVIVMSYLIKVIIIFCLTPFTILAKRMIHNDFVQI